MESGQYSYYDTNLSAVSLGTSKCKAYLLEAIDKQNKKKGGGGVNSSNPLIQKGNFVQSQLHDKDS